VQYLGYVLSEDGVSASADKVKAIENYPTPNNARDVRAFLGLTSFYRKLVPNYAETVKTSDSTDSEKSGICLGPQSTRGVQELEK